MILSARPLRVILDSNIYMHGRPGMRLAVCWKKLESLVSDGVIEVFFTYVNSHEMLSGLWKPNLFEKCREELRRASRLCQDKRLPAGADYLSGKVAACLGLPKPSQKDYVGILWKVSNAKNVDELSDIVAEIQTEHEKTKANWVEYKNPMDKLREVTKRRNLDRTAAYHTVARLTWQVCLRGLGLEHSPHDNRWQGALSDVPSFRYQVTLDTEYLLKVLGGGKRRRGDAGDLSQIPYLDTVDYLITADDDFFELCHKAGNELPSACIWEKDVGRLRVLPPRAPIYDDILLPSH